MNKLFYGGALLATIFTAIGAVMFPEHPTMWLSSTSNDFVLIRCGLAIALFGLLISRPPRNLAFRGLLGAASVIVTAWAVTSTYQNIMQPLDSVLMLGISIAFGVAALEFDPQPEPTTAQTQ